MIYIITSLLYTRLCSWRQAPVYNSLNSITPKNATSRAFQTSKNTQSFFSRHHASVCVNHLQQLICLFGCLSKSFYSCIVNNFLQKSPINLKCANVIPSLSSPVKLYYHIFMVVIVKTVQQKKIQQNGIRSDEAFIEPLYTIIHNYTLLIPAFSFNNTQSCNNYRGILFHSGKSSRKNQP